MALAEARIHSAQIVERIRSRSFGRASHETDRRPQFPGQRSLFTRERQGLMWTAAMASSTARDPCRLRSDFARRRCSSEGADASPVRSQMLRGFADRGLGLGRPAGEQEAFEPRSSERT